MTLLRTYFPTLFITTVTLLVLGTSFFQSGYILTLDTVWGPTFPLTWDADGFNNTYIVRAVIYILSLVIPTMIVQKLFLLLVIVSLLYIPWKYTPYITSAHAKIFSSLFYALNPFVCSRILSGQWFHLVGYALLPLLIHRLIALTTNKKKKDAYLLGGSLFLISLFSIHFLYLACIISCLWISVHVLRDCINRNWNTAKQITISFSIAFLLFLISCSYWIVPAVLRTSPLESRFDQSYYDTFASAPHGDIPTMMNVGALGGFWGEDTAWGLYFIWPQGILLFWIVFFFALILIITGAVVMLRKKELRLNAILLVCIGALAYITALGTSDTPLRAFNIFLYDHVPLWNGLRDSHKIVGILALVYAIFGGIGIDWLREKSEHSWGIFRHYTLILALIIPSLFGIYMWGGFHGQLKPVDYPSDWYEAEEVIDAMPLGEKVLVLPWHGYLSLSFNSNYVVANPTELFFGKNRIVSGRSVEFGDIRDQEVDANYRELDTFMRTINTLDENQILTELQKRNITKILIITNPSIPNSEKGLTRWTEFYDNEEIDNEEQKTWKELLPQQNIDSFSTGNIHMMSLDK